MIVTRRIALRIALIVLLAVVLQVSFFSYISCSAATPNVLPVVIVSLGLLGGAVVGAVCGFAAGLPARLGAAADARRLLARAALDRLPRRPLPRGRRDHSRWIPALLAGGLTLVGAAGFAAIQLMLGVDTPVSLLVIREIVVQALLAILLAFAVYPLIRRVLRAGAGRLPAAAPAAAFRAALAAAPPAPSAAGLGRRAAARRAAAPRRRTGAGLTWSR